MWRFILGTFLIAHGLIHASYGATPPAAVGGPPWPFQIGHSWLLSGAGLGEGTVRGLGTALWVATTAGFLAASVGIFGMPLLDGMWRGLAAGSAVLSLLLLVFFWHPWLVLGILIDGAILVSVLGRAWPSAALGGS
jgi:hypothetical protein